MIVKSDKRTLQYQWGKGEDNAIPKIEKEYNLKPGNPFPNLAIRSENGFVNTDSLLGKVVVINWWATNCALCIEEIPGLNGLVEKYNQENVLFFSIIWDKENLERFLVKHPYKYTHGYSNDEIIKLLGNSFPRNIIVDQTGKIVHNKLGAGPNTVQELDSIINELH